MLAFGDLAQQIDQRLVSLPSFGSKARHDVAEITFVERRVLIDVSGKKPFAQRTERHKTNSEFFTSWQHFLFRFSPPQRIFALQRSHRLDCMRPTKCLHPGF